MLLKFEIFVHDEYLGNMQRWCPDSRPPWGYSSALCCPACGDIWARIFTPDEECGFFIGWCEKHRSILLGGGTLVDHDYLAHFRNDWPLAIWQRELQLWKEEEWVV
jgi:hypothetical protein